MKRVYSDIILEKIYAYLFGLFQNNLNNSNIYTKNNLNIFLRDDPN